uniref:FliG_C domain-containing protein n=1 Tax=Strongyloides papillosus TaxID=174720 RepID=A0A0N5BSQ3_STREA
MSDNKMMVPGDIVEDEQSNLSVSDLKCSEDPEVVMEKLEESEMVPGLFDFIKKHEIELDKIYRSFKSSTELDNGDVKLINDLSNLTPDDLMEFIVNIQNRSFQLAKEEATQYARGRILGIIDNGLVDKERMLEDMKQGANIY